ncbi:MAG: non-homologous end-joining DNA ligase [bacterium]
MPRKDPLAEYRKKRDFGKTPEPAPAPVESTDAAAPTGAFVIHRHEARALHYDLRLEMDGVLKCFAIPRGFSWDPADKHLAVHTEDHPIEYMTFDGVIPKGAYGAGTMVIWDKGTYRALGDGPAGLENGKLEIDLDGGRLRGEWHMVKTRGERDWLMFKYKDRYAREAGVPLFPLDLSRVERAVRPERPRAMRAAGKVAPFSHPDWIFELAFDGRRAFASLEGDDVRFLGADGAPIEAELPGIALALRRLRARRALVDGVLVATGEDERPSRALLDEKLAGGDPDGVVFYAFDLLHYDDWSLAPYPLVERKAALASILPPSGTVLHVDHVVARGEELCEVVVRTGLAGVIAKEARSAYSPGASPAWREIRVAAPPKDAAATPLRESLATGARRKSRVKLTNRDKVYWPKEGITKGQLLDYYESVADVLLPYLRDRPCHMLRYPDGIEGKSFYQKNVTGRIPDWVPTTVIGVEGGEEVRYVVCNDRDTLLHLVNLGSIDIHPWLSRVGTPDVPDLAVVDLDPSASDFSKVIRIAQTVGKILRGAGLRPCVKTSGATGLHIYIPLVREYGYEQVRMFCELVARLTVREHRDIATVERTPAKRGDKVYVDFGQNRREQTLVPPYVVRPVPGATVSTPLDWDEVRSGLHPSQFDLFGVPERIEQRGDLFRGALDDPQRLEDAIDALGAR